MSPDFKSIILFVRIQEGLLHAVRFHDHLYAIAKMVIVDFAVH
jgi:hypothetical protein